MSDAQPATRHAEADDPTAAVQRYLEAYGLTPVNASRVAADLQCQQHAASTGSGDTTASEVGPEPSADAEHRARHLLEAFIRWTQNLGEHLEPRVEPAKVVWAMTLYGPELLNRHPDAIVHPDPLLEDLRDHLEAWPHGVLPQLPPREMHRQPLGELPSVLRGEFWSGTYRWAMPAGARRGKPTPPAPPPPGVVTPDTVAPPPGARPAEPIAEADHASLSAPPKAEADADDPDAPAPPRPAGPDATPPA